MPDQPTTDAVIEGAKTVGSGGGWLALAWMTVQRITKKVEVDDEREAKALEAMAAEMKQLNTIVGAVNGKLDVLTERTSNMRNDMDKLEAENKAVLDRLARLEGKFDHLSEQLAK
jgi:predicted nuclease with TOPRIM domain